MPPYKGGSCVSMLAPSVAQRGCSVPIPFTSGVWVWITIRRLADLGCVNTMSLNEMRCKVMAKLRKNV